MIEYKEGDVIRVLPNAWRISIPACSFGCIGTIRYKHNCTWSGEPMYSISVKCESKKCGFDHHWDIIPSLMEPYSSIGEQLLLFGDL